ncbi:hypothetical protein RB2083_1505 [Rhodobacteraceae bacterium HTCC2083]|nr:hypothetical protein RB2083_1505 [Rhodobacteraceae bacterium HTCC2083]
MQNASSKTGSIFTTPSGLTALSISDHLTTYSLTHNEPKRRHKTKQITS